ncbi:enoyl-CoA hydratase/isomerase family protein [Lentzea sp. NPDC059081]|uniref:enoyl-CoA hydratase/isomerase family protein n=1 Tax=Lentzea sp. NPDC059081 TaxID=3346719 RepID=UPI003685DB31
MLRTSEADGVVTLVLDRPARLNALTRELVDALTAAVGEAGRDARAVVITGAGRAFSAGADLELLASLARAGQVGEFMAESVTPLVAAITSCPVPVVSAVNGPCVGGAVGLALLADVTLADRSAYFLLPQVPELGLVPDVGATWALARSAGRARALGMALTGERVSAEQAERWGLIWACVDDVVPRAHALALRLATNPAAALATRKLVDAALLDAVAGQVERENADQARLAAR